MLHSLYPDMLLCSVGRRRLSPLLDVLEKRSHGASALLFVPRLLSIDIRYLHELLLQRDSVSSTASVLLLSILNHLLYLILVNLLFKLLIAEDLLQRADGLLAGSISEYSRRSWPFELETEGRA